MDEPKARTWWKKKRWRAAAGLWLALSPPVLYVLAIGPIVYCDGRGGMPKSWYPAYDAAYGPLRRAVQGTRFSNLLDRYAGWWGVLSQSQ